MRIYPSGSVKRKKKGRIHFLNLNPENTVETQERHKKYLFRTCPIHIFAHEHNCCFVFVLYPTPEIIIKTNGYKLSAQTFLELFGRTSVT